MASSYWTCSYFKVIHHFERVQCLFNIHTTVNVLSFSIKQLIILCFIKSLFPNRLQLVKSLTWNSLFSNVYPWDMFLRCSHLLNKYMTYFHILLRSNHVEIVSIAYFWNLNFMLQPYRNDMRTFLPCQQMLDSLTLNKVVLSQIQGPLAQAFILDMYVWSKVRWDSHIIVPTSAIPVVRSSITQSTL